MAGAKLTPNLLETASFDTAVSLTGYGKFHYQIITVCSLCILTVGFQNGVSSYVFPAAQCELNLTSIELGYLNVAFLAGGTISSFLWGILTDMYGRRIILITTHLLNASVAILLNLSPYTITLVVCRFLNGFLIGAPGGIIYSYFSEFQPPKYRSRAVCYCGLFFTLAWLLLPIFAYLILPIEIHYRLGDFLVLTPWRLLLILLALPEVVVAACLTRMPESPKFHFAKGNRRKAIEILRRMYSSNTGEREDLFPVKNLICHTQAEIDTSGEIIVENKTIRVLKQMTGQVKILFQTPLVKVTALTTCIMFANMFGMFGLGLWLPDLFIRFEQYHQLHPNATISVKQLSSLVRSNDTTCEPSFDSSVIESTIAMALTALLLNGISCWISVKIETRKITMICMIVGGISAGCIYWMTSSLQNLVVACIFQATMITANMTIASVGVELFPTKVNGIAVCLIVCAGRLGAVISNVVFGYFIDEHCEVPIFVVALISLLGGSLCIILPRQAVYERSDADNLEKKDIEISVINSSSRY